MKSRLSLVALFLFLSGLLAFLPVVEVTASGSSVASVPAPEAAAQTKAKQKQKKRAAAKKKQRQQRTKQQKRQKAKKNRNVQRADDVTQVSTPGQTDVPRLPGGRLPGSARQVAQAQNAGEQYIVLFRNDRVQARVLTTALDEVPGVIPTNIFEHSVKGFAGHLTPAARETLEQDPRVLSVTKDRQRFLAAQTLPRGINRVDADLNPVAAINGGGPGVNVDRAIIDTGADLEHPDLNVFVYADCASDPNSPDFGWDLDGHGTHVAGTAAAIDNDIGVVGVAPGARLWPMRVMDDNGVMFDSYIIDCMDLVTFYASDMEFGETVDVANMSLGGFFPEDRCNVGDAFNDAVCGMVNAGVTVVVAAGNEAEDAADYNPANIDEVITVSALADSDGQPGGLGGSFNATCQFPQTDEGLATFSNFGADVDIAAPGIDVLSTFPTYLTHSCTASAGVGYDIFPGTSMASPHVAGAAGLLLSVNPNLTPVQVKAALQASREQVAMAGDPDGINEGILNLGDPAGPPPPPPVDSAGPTLSVAGPASATVGQRVTFRVTANDPSGIARVELFLCKPGCRKVAQDAAAPYQFVRRHSQPGRVKYKVRAFDNAGNFTDRVKNIRIRPKN